MFTGFGFRMTVRASDRDTGCLTSLMNLAISRDPKNLRSFGKLFISTSSAGSELRPSEGAAGSPDSGEDTVDILQHFIVKFMKNFVSSTTRRFRS